MSAPSPPSRRAVVLLIAAALLIYNLNGRTIASSDTRGTRFVPFALLKGGTLRLDPVLDAVRTSRHAYWVQPTPDGGHASLFPVVAPLLATPIYAPAAFLLARQGWPPAALARAGERLEKLAASVIAAATAGLMLPLLRRRMNPPRALGLTIAFAFGTETWMIGSQALWQHGTEELLLTAALLALTGVGPLTSRALAAGGLACGLAIAARPLDALLVAPFALLVPFWIWTGRDSAAADSADSADSAESADSAGSAESAGCAARADSAGPAGSGWRRATWFYVAAALPIALMFAYNLATFGLWGGGYELFIRAGRRYFEGSLAEGLAGLLFGTDKGLFFYTPFLLFLALRLFPNAASNAAPNAASSAAPDAASSAALNAASSAAPVAVAAAAHAATSGTAAPRRALQGFLSDRNRSLDWFVAAAIVLQLLVYARSDWRGGTCYGPRYLTDVLPLLTWLLAPAVEALSPIRLGIFRIAVGFGIAVQIVGAFCYPRGASDLRIEGEGSHLPAYLIEAPAGIVTPGWLDALRRPSAAPPTP